MKATKAHPCPNPTGTLGKEIAESDEMWKKYSSLEKTVGVGLKINVSEKLSSGYMHQCSLTVKEVKQPMRRGKNETSDAKLGTHLLSFVSTLNNS